VFYICVTCFMHMGVFVIHVTCRMHKSGMARVYVCHTYTHTLRYVCRRSCMCVTHIVFVELSKALRHSSDRKVCFLFFICVT